MAALVGGAAVSELRLLQDRLRNGRVWGLERGTGTFLTLEVGDEVRPGLGRAHVWVQYCDWQVLHDGVPVLSSAKSHAREYAVVLARLDGSTLQSIASVEAGGIRRFTLGFSRGYELRARADLANYDPDDDLVVVFFEGGPTVAINQASGVYTESDQ